MERSLSSHLWAFTREQRAHSSLPSLSGSAQWQCSVLLSIDGSNTPRQFFTRQPAGNTCWFGLATLHTQLIPVTPITIKTTDLDSRKTLPCYFNDPIIFTVAATPRLGFQTLLCRWDRSPQGQRLSLLAVQVPAVAPARHQCHLLAAPAGSWLRNEQFSWGHAFASCTHCFPDTSLLQLLSKSALHQQR